MQELWVEGDALLQEEAIGKSDHVVGVIVRQSGCQVLQQRELHAWRAEGDTHIHTVDVYTEYSAMENMCTSPLLCYKVVLKFNCFKIYTVFFC